MSAPPAIILAAFSSSVRIARAGEPFVRQAVGGAMRMLEADLARRWTLTGLAADLPLAGGASSATGRRVASVVAMLAAVAIADYFFQYRQWYERQKMSLQEIKDEFKQSEGDPHIKGKIRQLRQQRMKKRMMAAVPTASVIITNPTHYSVALSYDRGMSAPVCVAKGADNIAFKIREVANRGEIPGLVKSSW